MILEECGGEVSPDGRFQLKVDVYSASPERTYGELSVITLIDVETGQEISVLYRDDDRFWHAWVTRADGAYLVCSESLEGQTVVDLTSRTVASVTGEDDPFIGVEYHASPNGQRLAVLGCYWACPYVIQVYDFEDPMSLPWRVLADFVLPQNDWSFARWVDHASIAVRSPDAEERIFTIPGSSDER